ncbi:MAG: molecular chaperone HtpG [Erysipelotrichaceae bacterium]|nr:molecular chaperone HtpG [Erysipelotrichaceae bacterium]
MKKQFKAESKRLLDLMINSIYTNKEIFLRELISNASDAIDKLHFISLTDPSVQLNEESLFINLSRDEEKRQLIISDNGIGMDKESLENNLGVIARSGSLEFKTMFENEKVDDIIGQFGVGFYSAFMVSKKVSVLTKAYSSEQAYLWESTGEDGYTIKESTKDTVGTVITLDLKDDSEDETYHDFLSEYKLKELVKKYSDYIRYPIRMEVTKSRLKEGSEEDYESYTEIETLNSMIPLWKRNKNEITTEEYNDFYKSKFNDYEDPLKIIHFNIEGNVSFNALLFIPARIPYNYYTKEYEKGLQLYSKNVFIMDKAAELVPEHFRFVKGLVDSQDLSLNISREMLQHDRQLKVIASRIEKKIKSELSAMLSDERETYEKFWKTFGVQIKYGVYNEFGANKELLQDLLMFVSSKEEKLVTLDEYVSRMPEDQKEIYYASGESAAKIAQLPQTEKVKDKGYEILYLTDEVDEFALQILMTYKEKKFKSISQGDLDLDTEAEKEERSKKQTENKDLLAAIAQDLSGKVKDVRVSSRLKSHPVCLVADEGLSMEMEKVLNNMPENPGMKAEKILEINSDHPIFAALKKVYEQDPSELKNYSDLLYDQALLIEGFNIEDPLAFSAKLCDLMVKVNK